VELEIGPSDGVWTVVLGGELNAGDMVITDELTAAGS
jgi:hypothetical protein